MPAEVRFTCPLHNGLHARPASMLAEAVRAHKASATLTKSGGTSVDAGSVLSVVGLDVQYGDACILEAKGADAHAVIAAVRVLIDGAWARAEDEPATKPAQSSQAASSRKPANLPIGLRQHNIAFAPGTPACHGVGRGVAVLVAGLSLSAAMRDAKPRSLHAEIAAASAAITAVTADLRNRAAAAGRKFEKDLLAAHAEIASDPALTGEVTLHVRAGKTAAQAVVLAAGRFMDQLRAASSAYVRDRVIDIQDVCMQIIDRLKLSSGGDAAGGESGSTLVTLDQDSIVVAEVLTANQLMSMDHRLLKGLVLGAVGVTSHTVILARSLSIPTLLDARQAMSMVSAGDALIVDGDNGLMLAADSAEVQRYYQIVDRTAKRRRDRLEPIAKRPGATRDGVPMEVAANASMPGEVTSAVALGAQGVGLLRTELLFLDRPHAPSEQEQFEAYAAVVDAAAGGPVIIRTFDIGGDKPAAYMTVPQEDNPFLGLRGIRLYPQYLHLLKVQLRAIIRVSARGPVKVMAPMVAIASEAEWFRQQVRDTQAELLAEDVKFDANMPVGVMVEVPSVSLAIDELCEHADFLSVGTNDLCQYWMAVDRGNKSVAGLYNARQPSFLRLLHGVVKIARARGTWIGICGEMAGDRRNLPLLVGMGVDEISVAPGEVLNLKAALAKLDSAQCRQVLAGALACKSLEAVDAFLASPQPGSDQSQSVLDSNAVVVGSDARTKHEAIKEAVDALFVAGRTEQPGVVEAAVWAREATYSTGLGYGFAVPHCKTESITAATLAVIKLKTPVEWGSSDGLPVGIVLLLVVPAGDTAGTHMKVFAKLARKLMHEEFRDQLAAALDATAIERTLREHIEL